jgi:Rrf2 family cysteine metabolism transcriptional repressor
MLFSRKTDYALLILAHLHTHPDGGNARTIAESYGLSRAFVANILKELCQKGFVASHRGVKGGYALERSADEIPISEVLESLEDGFRLATCTGHEDGESHPDDCAVGHVCPIKGPIGELHQRILNVLQNVTLAELFRPSLPPIQYQLRLPLLNTTGTIPLAVPG